MAGYEKQTWVDKISDVTAERMNHIEKGIEDAGKTGGVETGSVIGWTGSEIPEGYEEVDSSLIPSSSGVEVGTIVEWDESEEIPEGYEIIETDSFMPDFTTSTKITLDIDNSYTLDEDAFIQITGKINADTSSDVNIQADGKTFYYLWAKNIMTDTAMPAFLKKGTTLVVASSVNSTISAYKMSAIKKKKLKKVAVTELDPITGSIVDTTNIDNKAENTYSAEIIDTELGKKQDTLIIKHYLATKNPDYIAEGKVEVQQYGKLVILTFVDIVFAIEQKHYANNILFSNIPVLSAKYSEHGGPFPYTILDRFNASETSGARISINYSGNIVNWYAVANTTDQFCGQLIYFTD